MTESDLAVHNGRRVLKTVVEPRQTIERVQQDVREMHQGIQTMLDGLKECYADKGAEMSELACEGEVLESRVLANQRANPIAPETGPQHGFEQGHANASIFGRMIPVQTDAAGVTPLRGRNAG
jgi:hypothetical protein